MENFVTIASYNMSFATGLGLKIGSEKKFIHDALHREKLDDPKELFENSLKMLKTFFEEKKPDFVGLQEVNDTDFSPKAMGTRNVVNYLCLENSDYEYFIYGQQYENVKPTIMMFWNKKKLGKAVKSYGGELGCDEECEENNYNAAQSTGRPIQMVVTDKDFVLINLHGPNSKKQSMDKMPFLTKKINEFITTNIKIKNFSKVFIVGDFNDPYGFYGKQGLELSSFPGITLRSRKSPEQERILSCCYNYDSADTQLGMYDEGVLTGKPGKFDEKMYSLDEIKERGQISTYLFEGDYCLGFTVKKNLSMWRKSLDVFSKESDHELVWAEFWYD